MDSANKWTPIVILERNRRLEGSTNQTAFNAREFEHSQNGNPKAMQIDIPLDESNSHMDLPEIKLNIPPPKIASTSNCATDYKTSFAKIFNNQTKMKDEIAAIMQNRIELETIVNASTNGDQSSVKESNLETDDESWLHRILEIGDDKWMLPSENRIEEHPGEIIMHYKERGKVFKRKQLTFTGMENPVDTMLQGLSCEMIDEIIKSGMFTLYFLRLTDKAAAIRLLFRLMSVHEDNSVMVKCEELLLSLLKANPAESDAIGLKEVLEVLVNCGTSLKKLIHVPELLDVVEGVVVIHASDMEEQVETKAEANPLEHYLKSVLHVLLYLISHGVSKTLLEPDHITVLVVVLSTLALDTNLKTSVVLVEIRGILDELLLRFSVDEWTYRAVLLAKYLSSISEIPQNMAHVAMMFCFSERGHHLQRVTSFIMCHKLLGMELQMIPDDVMPQALLSLIEDIPKRMYDEDLCILYNVMVLVNLCMGQNGLHGNWKILQELSSVMKKIANGIKTERNAMDRIKIRDMATTTYMKWTILANSLPKSQKPLFEECTSLSQP